MTTMVDRGSKQGIWRELPYFEGNDVITCVEGYVLTLGDIIDVNQTVESGKVENVRQLWEQITKLTNQYWDLYKNVRDLEDDAYLQEKVTWEEFKKIDKIYTQMEEIGTKKVDIFKKINEETMQSNLNEP